MPDFDLDAALAGPVQTEADRIADNQPGFDIDAALNVNPPQWNPSCITDSRCRSRRTFFYPGAGLDFQPLFRLTHLFDRFVFCDLQISEDRFRWAIEGIHNIDADRQCHWPADGLELLELRRLRPASIPLDRENRSLLGRIEMSADEHYRYWRLHDRWQHGPKWGMAATLSRRIGSSHRRITLFYLGAEATVTYLKLFSIRRTAPGAICIKPYFADFGLKDWQSLLGRAVRSSDAKPDIIFGAGGDIDHPSTWPWNVLWQNYGRGWDVDARVANSLPPLFPQVLEGRRRIHLVSTALSPENLGNAQAVITKSHHADAGWPAGLEVITLGQILNTERGGRATEDERSIQPLDKALQRLDDICRNRGIERVAAVPFGFEDEGQVLNEWRVVDGWPKEIVFHCPTHGDFHSLGGSFNADP